MCRAYVVMIWENKFMGMRSNLGHSPIQWLKILVEMYVKCNSLDDALRVFEEMTEWDDNIEPGIFNNNSSPLLVFLSACADAGLLNEGLKYFESMKRDDYIEPGAEHYGCLVNLLGLSGCLDQALELIKKMPMKPDSAIWGSWLSSCRSHGNLEIAAIAIEHLLELEPVDMGNCLAFESLCRLGKVGWCIENEETYE